MIKRTDHSRLGHWWWTVDRWLLGAFALLIGCGTMLIAAASPANAERLGMPSFYFVSKHLFYLVPSLLLMVAISTLTHLQIRRLAVLSFMGAFLALIATFVVGVELNGARRWISVLGVSVQPSEFIKPLFAVVAAWLFAAKHRDPQFPGTWLCLAIYGATIGLLLLQPDLGMVVVLSGVMAAQFFMAGLPLSIMAGLVVALVAGLFVIYLTFPHVTSRIDRFLDPETGDTYQVDRALQAFQNGGLFGTGPGQGEIKRVLPDAHADFIFAVAGEEFGALLTIMLIGIYAFIIVRGLWRARQTDQLFPMLAAGGLLVQFGGQALIHMGSSLHLLPAKGMTLPFVSYGGSSLLAIGLLTGMLLGLTRRNEPV